MLRKILGHVPLVHHRPPMNIPLRKAIIMSLQRPVKLKKIEELLLKRLNMNGVKVVEELKEAVFYLRKERFFKRDSSNLFVAGLRALCNYDEHVGIEFGKSLIGELPDMRAIRTLVTFMNRTKRFNEIPSILQYSKDAAFSKEKRNYLIQNNSPSNDQDEIKSPWTFELYKPCKLSKKPTYFRHKFDELSFSNVEGLYLH